MQLVGVSSLVFLALQGSVEAVQSAITCTTTADCAWGETCVAGDADTSVQACVPTTVCGGSSMGNCPSDDTGKLACLWRPFDDCSQGCAILNGNKGIYKCVSITRCDAYYGGSSCSDSCSVNGVRCNGQGSCNMMPSSADGTPVFGCTCDNGYSGDKCEVAPGSTSTNTSSTDDDDDSFFGAQDSDDASNNGSDDDNTSDSSKNTLDDSATDASEDSTTDTSDESSADAVEQSSTDADESPSDDTEDDSASRSRSTSSSGELANSESVSTTTHSGIRPGVLILVLVMTAFFLVGTVLLVAYSRRRKQQEEEEYANALASTQGVGAVGARDLAAGHTGRTPRAHIATM
ncbi:hypothetical protein PInf_009124 [Phytophthora infestans]|nr:hypothetical protein PInf_009124 [Phytophthora infestans]